MGDKRPYKPRKPGAGRKPLKPNYDAAAILQEQIQAAVVLYEEDNSLQTIADTLSLNPIKVRKLLITAGVYESEIADVVNASFEEKQGIPIAEDTGEASWIDEGEEIPESDTTFGQTMLSAYKLGTMIKISNELLNDSAFDLATYIARRFGVRMGNAEERAFITGDGVGKPLGLLAETGGAKVGVTAAQKDAVSFDEIFKLYYALKAPYRKKAQFLCNEALVLQLMTIKDNNGNYIWKPGLEIGKPDTLLNRPLKTSAFMPEIKGGSKVMAFGDYSYYWVADRQNRTFRRLNELYARTDQVGFLTTQRVDGKLILPEAVQLLQMAPQG